MNNVLNLGYIKFIESWGADERIIEAARMSTGGGFISWEPYEKHPNGDAGLLSYLWRNKHYTPFEMAGLVIEVKAPIVVFREWHRHRTQSYNEMSGRYIELPNENYLPTLDRVIDSTRPTKNKQAASSVDVQSSEVELEDWLDELQRSYDHCQKVYKKGLKLGIAKEVARLCLPVARYSIMRASGNLRNWLHFLSLRTDPTAQWEIRQYANIVAGLVRDRFPRAFKLWEEK